MSKVAEYIQEFLKNGGNELGYDEENMPEFSHIDTILRHHIPVWEYKGTTKEKYYK